LGTTGRLSKERVLEAVGVFSNTIDEQVALEAQTKKSEEEARELSERAMRLEQVAGGPMTPENRLAQIGQVDDAQRMLLVRQTAEAEALMRQINTQRALITSMIDELNEKQAAFDLAVDTRVNEMQDEDFREAVAMLEGIPPRQAKQVLQEMLDAGNQDQVVSYLSAMQQRKAAAVLREFKLPNEIAQAAILIEQVRQRTDQITQEAGL